ncbi:MAG TPA: efflux RND transporter permease subunit [Planctomycetes bacterium]|nr:efflux RND transporter permease subunit [Planctomycetota bacterium]HIJ69861.1 efflux RND transporter permease subunit [Planctomycetota bacterium]
MNELIEESKGPLAWFARNHVAANLLMLLILVAGFMSILTIRVEFFPEMSVDIITVTVPYLGASPDEVENGVALRVEEAVAAVDGIKRIRSTSSEGSCMVIIEVEEYADTKDVLDNVKAEVDRIITFPEETEKPIITEITTRNEVLTIVLYGDTSEKTLRELAEEVRDELTSMDNISQATMAGIRNYEISIEVSEENLRRYGLSFDEVSNAVKRTSLDVPGGSVKTPGGEIMFRAKGQMYYGNEFEKIVVLTRPDGTRVLLGDIAEVIDGFEDSDISSRFDGKKAAFVLVYRVGEQGTLDIANTISKYIKDKRNYLPEGVSIGIWEDNSKFLRSRMNLLQRNAMLGLCLVFLCLALFLDLKLAFWTTMGIPISFLGAFWLMPLVGVSLNMISLFAFIMSLGLVVDDAIVVGENIFAYRQDGMRPIAAAIKGVREMAAPVTMAVLTTVFAFLPLMYTKGIMGKVLKVIPLIVISVLLVSLVEALLILPAHLSVGRVARKTNSKKGLVARFHLAVGRMLEAFINGPFARLATAAVRLRYVTLSCGIAIFLSTVGLIVGGYIKFTFFDAVEADNMIALVTMPQGTALEQTSEVVKRIEAAAGQVRREVDSLRPGQPSIFRHVSTVLGDQPTLRKQGGPMEASPAGVSAAHLAEVNVELLGAEERGEISSIELKNRWRQLVGEIPGVSSLTFESEWRSVGEDINVELTHDDFDMLLAAAEQLKLILRDYEGVTDIKDSFEEGKREVKLAVKDAGRTLGLTLADLARQVRQGFYGEEAQRIQRGKNDIRVMVRYPEDQRTSLADIENMRIRLPDGTQIPFNTVADVKYGRGYANIRRVDRRRVINVTGDVDEAVANAGEINRDLAENIIPELMIKYPGLTFRFSGAQRERSESLGSLRTNFVVAMLAIYGLLAVQFRSYAQPVIVMSAIPFGLVGATVGHLLMGFNLSILSLFGIVALAGVVVNDSLIMIDLINRERASGIELVKVVRDSVTRRFRPIMLTTLTTFLGLAPMLLEKSIQARFLIPMAISLAFGVAFATMITLLLVPSLYMVLEDIKALPAKLTRNKQM